MAGGKNLVQKNFTPSPTAEQVVEPAETLRQRRYIHLEAVHQVSHLWLLW